MIEFKGQPLSELSAAALNRYRQRSMGMVFQFYHLLPELTVLENDHLNSQYPGPGVITAVSQADRGGQARCAAARVAVDGDGGGAHGALLWCGKGKPVDGSIGLTLDHAADSGLTTPRSPPGGIAD